MAFSSRERILASLSHEEPDRVPTALWGSWYGVTDRLYFNLLAYLGWEPVAPFRPDRVHSVNYYDDRLLERLGTDVRHIDPGTTAATARLNDDGTDCWGITYDTSGLYRTARTFPFREANIDQILNTRLPGAERVDERAIRERMKAIRAMPHEYAVAGRAVASYGFFEMAQSLRGHDRLMMDLIEDPDLVVALLTRLSNAFTDMMVRFLEVTEGVLDLLELPGDDYAGNKHPIISPRLFDRFFKPVYASLIARIRAVSPNTRIVFHSDGAIAPFLPRLTELGLDAVHPVEPLPDSDQGALKQQFGNDISFIGGIDIRESLQGSPERVRDEVRMRLVKLSPGGGYILAPSNHLQWDVPPENVLALFDAAREFGGYGTR